MHPENYIWAQVSGARHKANLSEALCFLVKSRPLEIAEKLVVFN